MRKNYAGNNLSQPEEIANLVIKAVTSRKPKTRYLYGFMAKPMVIIKNLLGDRNYDHLLVHMGK